MPEQYVHEVKYPKQVRPGDERYVEEAIRVTTGKSVIRLDFLFQNHVRVVGAYAAGSNSLVLPRGLDRHALGLKYVVSDDSPTGCRKDLAVVVYRRKLVVWRIALSSLLLAVAVLPIVISSFRIGLFALQVQAGEFALATLPLGLVLAALFSWRRIVPVITNLLTDDIFEYEIAAERGTSIGSIEILRNIANPEVGVWPHQGP